MKTKHYSGVVLVATCLISFFLTGPSIAQDKVIELSYATQFAPDHVMSTVAKKWMDKIEKETNGRVKFKVFWGGTLLGPTAGVDELAQGVADIGTPNVGYSKDGFDFAKGSFLFFNGSNAQIHQRIIKEMRKKFPEIEQEYEKKGVKAVCWYSGYDYQVVSRKPVRKLADFRGMRMRATGEQIDLLKVLGAEGITLSGVETYVNLQKGIIDGTLQPFETFKSQRLGEVCKFGTYLNLPRAITGGTLMSLKAWNKLPKDIQTIFEKNMDWYGQEMETDYAKVVQEGIEIGKKLGVEFITLPKEENEKFEALIHQEALKSAKVIDAKGVPGTKMYQEIQRLIQTYSKK